MNLPLLINQRNIARILGGFFLVAIVVVFSFANHVMAATIVSTPTPTGITFAPLPNMVNYHDFVVGPGKTELTLSPGQSQVVDLTIANRLGSDKTFSISEEDFTGSDNPNQTVVLLGSDRGPYSLKDDIQIPASKLKIPFGQNATIPITVSVPADAQPGALYGSVLVSVVSAPGTTTTSGEVTASNPVITRIGTLFFVRIPGAVDTAGQLAGFSLSSGPIVWSSSLNKTSPIFFDILFRNTGNVYLTPSGTITVDNILGSPIASAPVDAWFAMPQSLRFRQVEWDPMFLFGRYTAHLSVYRGYNDSTSNATTTDVATLVFWVIPWKLILLVFVGLIVIIWFLRWVFSHIAFVSKK